MIDDMALLGQPARDIAGGLGIVFDEEDLAAHRVPFMPDGIGRRVAGQRPRPVGQAGSCGPGGSAPG